MESQRTPDAPRAGVRTAAATRGKMRAAEERWAERLLGRGWVSIPSDHPAYDEVRLVIERHADTQSETK